MRIEEVISMEIPTSIKKGIEPLTNGYIEKNHYGLDVEAVRGDLYSVQLAMPEGVVYYWEVESWDETDLFVKILSKTKRGSYIWMHNAQYDLGQLFPSLCEVENGKKHDLRIGNQVWQVELFYPNPSYFILRKKDSKSHVYIVKRVVMADTFEFFKTSLENAGKVLNLDLAKEDKPEFLGERRPSQEEIEQFVKYSKIDAELVRKIGEKGVADFHESYDVPLKYSVTGASLSSKVYRKGFLNRKIPYPEIKLSDKNIEKMVELTSKQVIGDTINHNDLVDMAMASYWGGRTEAFAFGTAKCEVFDYSSHYPNAMTQIKIPTEDNWVWSDQIRMPHAFYYIKGYLPRNHVLPFPLFKNRLNFPYGSFEGVVTGWEALQIKKYAEIEEVSGLEYWGESDNSFERYVRDFYKKKNEAKKGSRDYWFYKLLLNSLYGKTIERRAESHRIEDLNVDLDARYYSDKNMAKKVRKSFEAGGMFNPVIGSWITGFARAKLFEDMSSEMDDILYTDTDSIMIKSKSSYNFKTGSGLGALEKEVEGRGTFLREKLYYIVNDNDKIVKSGRHGFWKSPEELKSKIENREDKYTVKRMIQFREAQKRGLKPFISKKQERSISWKGSNKRSNRGVKQIAENLEDEHIMLDPLYCDGENGGVREPDQGKIP